MMEQDITKYIREVYEIATLVYCLTDAARTDKSLPRGVRVELVLELSRLKANIADCVSSLVAINNGE